MINYYGYNPPFFGGHQKVMSRQSADRLIKNDILQLLLTAPGERLMRPTWGTNIKPSLFENIDENVISGLVANIEAALRVYEPRVSLSADITFDDDESILRIKLYGVFTNEPNHVFEDEIELPVKRSET
jgi:phage baseplate assembly protein W